MKIKHISVVLENAKGKPFEMTELLCRHDIDIRSFFVSVEADLSGIHIIVDKSELALTTLRKQGYCVREVDVIRQGLVDTWSNDKVASHQTVSSWELVEHL